jgi:TolA-binding protein
MDHISHKMISKLLIMQKANEKIQKQTSQINRLEGRVQQLEGDNQLLQQRVQQLEGDNLGHFKSITLVYPGIF